MTDWLMLIKSQILERGYDFFFDYQCDNDGEIKLSLWVSNGFENIYEDNYLFNACSYSTNRNGVTNAITRMLKFIQDYKEQPHD